MSDITAIIPTHNAGPYLEQSLRSALGQSIPYQKIVVVDDASSDGTEGLVRRIDDGIIEYIRLDTRSGPGAARNRGLDAATTTFTQFLDADDLLQPHLLQAFLDALRCLPDLDLFCFSGEPRFEAGCTPVAYNYERPFEGTFKSGRRAMDRMLWRGRYLASPCLYVFRKSITTSPPLLFPDLLHEDEVFTSQLFRRSGRTRVVRDPLYVRRVRSGSITSSPPSHERVEGRLRAHLHWKKIAGIDGVASWIPRRFYASRLFRAARRDASELDEAVARSIFSKLGLTGHRWSSGN